MLDLSLRELEYVATVDRDRNFTRAAASIPMAQPALSQAIARIERRLGVTLFNRTSRVVAPTPAGTLLAQRARRILAEVRAAAIDTQLTAGEGELRVHVTEPSLWVPRRGLAAIRSALPDCAVHQTTAPHADLSSQLRGGDLTLVLGPEVQGEGLDSKLMCREEVVALMMASHPLAARKAITAAELVRYPMVSIDPVMSSWNGVVDRMLARTGHRPRWTGSVAFGAVAGADLVTDGHAVLLVLDSIGRDQPPGRVSRRLAEPWCVEWHLSWRAGSERVPTIGAAITAITATLDSIGPSLDRTPAFKEPLP